MGILITEGKIPGDPADLARFRRRSVFPDQRKGIPKDSHREENAIHGAECGSDKESSVKTSIQKIISEENQRRSRMTETAFDEGTGEAGIFCISKSDLMTEAASEIQRNRLILGSISAVLLLAGFTNYFNVMVTGVLARKKELKIMENVGMTESKSGQ